MRTSDFGKNDQMTDFVVYNPKQRYYDDRGSGIGNFTLVLEGDAKC